MTELTLLVPDESDKAASAGTGVSAVGGMGVLASGDWDQWDPTGFPTKANTTNTGAIVGGVIGAVVTVIVLGVAFCFWRRKQRRSSVRKLDLTADDNHKEEAAPQVMTPFVRVTVF